MLKNMFFATFLSKYLVITKKRCTFVRFSACLFYTARTIRRNRNTILYINYQQITV
jgi:hypothetical protein